MGAFWVAPNMTVEQYDESKRLQVFYTRTKNWILAHAIAVSQKPDGGIPSLIIATSVFEPIGAILLGDTGNREKRFCAGFEYVFPNWSAISQLMYRNLRGGLFHEGFITKGLLIADLGESIVLQEDAVYVDPKYFVVAVSKRFEDFGDEIKNDKDGLESKFNAYWDRQVEIKQTSLGDRKSSIELPIATATGAVDSYHGSSGFSGAAPPGTTIDPRFKAQ
jgi:hypothetical protein